MFSFILYTVGPVFLTILAGFVAAKLHVLSDKDIDGLMSFATLIAVPCLLFRATSTLDLASAYNWRVLLAYFATAIACFALAIIITRTVFNRRPGEAVAVGFASLYSNLLLVGIPIIERAFGEEALIYAIALVSINAPVCYLIGITVMEGVRADGRSMSATAVVVLKTMFKNSLMIGIVLGLFVNISGLELPQIVVDSVDMIKFAALPCALFALGGVLTRYSLSQKIVEAGALSTISLVVQPVLAYLLCMLLGVDDMVRNVVVLMSATPVGLNAFLFAHMYARGVGVAANTVLIANALSAITVSIWLWILVK